MVEDVDIDWPTNSIWKCAYMVKKNWGLIIKQQKLIQNIFLEEHIYILYIWNFWVEDFREPFSYEVFEQRIIPPTVGNKYVLGIRE